jgi:glucans biosynthesis protein C
VAYHATIAYLPGVGAHYHVGDVTASWGFVVLAGFLHAWRMPAFFLLAGLLAAGLLERRGPRAFLIDRARRLLIPFAVLLPFVWAVDVAVTRWGRASGLSTLADPVPRPVHLWFLMALAGFSLMLVGLRAARLPAFFLGAALPVVLALVRVTLGEARPADAFIPDVASVLSYGACFFVGTQLRTWAGQGAEMLVVIGAAACLIVFSSHSQWEPAWAGLGAAAGGVVALGLLGISLRVTSEAPWLTWFLGGAYWLYLAHYPVVQVMHVLVSSLSVGGPTKYLLVSCSAIVLPLVSWSLVRQTRLGRLLTSR